MPILHRALPGRQRADVAGRIGRADTSAYVVEGVAPRVEQRVGCVEAGAVADGIRAGSAVSRRAGVVVADVALHVGERCIPGVAVFADDRRHRRSIGRRRGNVGVHDQVVSCDDLDGQAAGGPRRTDVGQDDDEQ